MFRSLASRLVALGIVQFLLLVATAIAIWFLEGPHSEIHPEDFIDTAERQKLETLSDDAQLLTAELNRLREERIEIALYDSSRSLIASNVDPPLALPPQRHNFFPPRAPRDGSGLVREPDVGSNAPSELHRSNAAEADVGDDDDKAAEPSSANSPDQRADRYSDEHDRYIDEHYEHERSMESIGRDHPPDQPMHLAHSHLMLTTFSPRGDHGFLVARGRAGEPPGMTGPLLTLLCGFGVLVIGALLTARWIVRPIDHLSRTARALGAGDLTARSHVARSDEIGELGRRFDDMADQIAGLLKSGKEMLAAVAHELRTPLARIGVALDLANEGDAAAARSSLQEIAVDVSELQAIIDDIFAAMQFELASDGQPAQLPMRKVATPVEDIAAAVAQRFSSRHPQRKLEVAASADARECSVDVDRVLFRRVLDNLLDNAHKYSPNCQAPIKLAVERNGNAIDFEVIDSGSGISPHDLANVFVAFFRGERSRSRETGGVGLGLTLAKRIVEAHGGTIAMTSTVGVGTRVKVSVAGTPLAIS